MANIALLPDEIAQLILQSIYGDACKVIWDRDKTFLNVVETLPHWIPILLDSCFLNDYGQPTTRYEEVWGYRHLVYLDEESGLWQVRKENWQPHGAKINGWRCRNGESSHVEAEEQELMQTEFPCDVDFAEEPVDETHESDNEQPAPIHEGKKRSRKSFRISWRRCFMISNR